MQVEVNPITVENSDTSTAASEHSDIQAKAEEKGCHWLLLSLILTLCVVTLLVIKVDCIRRGGGIVDDCHYNCQPCSDPSNASCPQECKESHYSDYCSSICETYESDWFIPFLIGFIIFYLLECFLCYEWAYSKHKMELNSFREYLTKLKSTPPEILVFFECSHYRKTGEYIGGIEQTEIVTTAKGSESFPFSSWKDNTGDISQVSTLQRIHLHKVVKFKDEETRQTFKRFKKQIKENNDRDDFFRMWTNYNIPGFIERALVRETDSRIPYCINGMIFWFWSFLLLTWPYRIYLEIVARMREFKVIKVVKAT